MKLPPMIIFENLQKANKGKCPVGMVVEGTKGRNYDQRFDDEFINSIVQKTTWLFFQLARDFADHGHRHFAYHKRIQARFSNLKTNVKFIAGGLTPLLPFMDTYVNKPINGGVKSKWTKWIEEGKVEYTQNPVKEKKYPTNK